jgi:hypothetical protein
MSSKGISYPQVAWPAAGTTSQVVSLAGQTVCGFYTPSGLSGTAITVQAPDPTTGSFVTVKDETGAALSYTVSAAGYTRVRPSDFAGLSSIRLVSGSSEAAGTSVRLAVREID